MTTVKPSDIHDTSAVQALRELLRKDAEQPDNTISRPKPLREEPWLKPVAWLVITSLGISVLGVALKQPLAMLVGFMLLVLVPPIMTVYMMLQVRSDWRNRRIESIQRATDLGKDKDQLIRELMKFSRPVLNFMADELTRHEIRVDRRSIFLIGKGYGVVTLIGFLLAGWGVMERFFASHPAYSGDVRQVAYTVLFTVFGVGLVGVFARHGVSAVTDYAAILRQVSQCKENLEKERKEQRELEREAREVAKEQREIEKDAREREKHERELRAAQVATDASQRIEMIPLPEVEKAE